MKLFIKCILLASIILVIGSAAVAENSLINLLSHKFQILIRGLSECPLEITSLKDLRSQGITDALWGLVS